MKYFSILLFNFAFLFFFFFFLFFLYFNMFVSLFCLLCPPVGTLIWSCFWFMFRSVLFSIGRHYSQFPLFARWLPCAVFSMNCSGCLCVCSCSFFWVWFYIYHLCGARLLFLALFFVFVWLITQLSRPGSRDWACTVHVAEHTLITWLIMHWSHGYHALITWLIIHCSRVWPCTDHVADHTLLT